MEGVNSRGATKGEGQECRAAAGQQEAQGSTECGLGIGTCASGDSMHQLAPLWVTALVALGKPV